MPTIGSFLITRAFGNWVLKRHVDIVHEIMIEFAITLRSF